MIYVKGKLKIESNIEVRTVREEGVDIDILLPIRKRTINLYLLDKPKYIRSRLQFPMTENIIFRFSIADDNNTCTIHLLKSIDFHSSVMNFEVDYENHYFYIQNNEHSVEIYIRKKTI